VLSAGGPRFRISLTGTPRHEELQAALVRAVARGGEGGLFLREWRWQTNQSGGATEVTVSFRYATDRQQPALLKAAQDRADTLVAELIRPGQSDFEKEVALHDWLVDHTAYDEAAYRSGTVPEAEFTPYGALIRGTGVCEAYASAFLMLASRAGLEARLVTGTAGGAAHSWNQVKIDGRWYHLDVTWDDPVGGPARKSYSYFNLPDDLLARSHQWNPQEAEPCNDTAADWFRQNGLAVDSARELRSLVAAAVREKRPRLQGRLVDVDPGRLESELKAALQAAANQAGTLRSWTYRTDEDTGAFEAAFTYR